MMFTKCNLDIIQMCLFQLLLQQICTCFHIQYIYLALFEHHYLHENVLCDYENDHDGHGGGGCDHDGGGLGQRNDHKCDHKYDHDYEHRSGHEIAHESGHKNDCENDHENDHERSHESDHGSGYGSGHDLPKKPYADTIKSNM